MVSDKFNYSESLAGSTLLAQLANSHDVFSAIEAGGTIESSVNQAIVQVFGSRAIAREAPKEQAVGLDTQWPHGLGSGVTRALERF